VEMSKNCEVRDCPYYHERLVLKCAADIAIVDCSLKSRFESLTADRDMYKRALDLACEEINATAHRLDMGDYKEDYVDHFKSLAQGGE
jgi:hypothetical protein